MGPTAALASLLCSAAVCSSCIFSVACHAWGGYALRRTCSVTATIGHPEGLRAEARQQCCIRARTLNLNRGSCGGRLGGRAGGDARAARHLLRRHRQSARLCRSLAGLPLHHTLKAVTPENSNAATAIRRMVFACMCGMRSCVYVMALTTSAGLGWKRCKLPLLATRPPGRAASVASRPVLG